MKLLKTFFTLLTLKEDALLCTQELHIGFHTEPDASRPHFFLIYFNIHISTLVC